MQQISNLTDTVNNNNKCSKNERSSWMLELISMKHWKLYHLNSISYNRCSGKVQHIGHKNYWKKIILISFRAYNFFIITRCNKSNRKKSLHAQNKQRFKIQIHTVFRSIMKLFLILINLRIICAGIEVKPKLQITPVIDTPDHRNQSIFVQVLLGQGHLFWFLIRYCFC